MFKFPQIPILPVLLAGALLGPGGVARADGDFIWAGAQVAYGSSNYGVVVTTDSAGNIYNAGHFSGAMDVDPGAGMTVLTSTGSRDIFVVKIDSAGRFVWARQFSGNSENYGVHDIAVDAAGNVHLSGAFEQTVDFDPGVGTANLTAGDSSDGFVVKLDSAGELVWAKQMRSAGGSGATVVRVQLALDAAGNVHTSAIFSGTVDFDPGTGVTNITVAGYDNIFVSKLNANGNFQWVKAFGPNFANEGDYGLAADGPGNVYLTGSFKGTVDFDPATSAGSLTSTGGWDAYVAKLGPDGNLRWARSFGGSGVSGFDMGAAVAVDAAGNVAVSGSFNGTTDFDPGSGTFALSSAGQSDAFVLKLSAAGNFLWARQLGNDGNDRGSRVVVDARGDIYSIGRMETAANSTQYLSKFDGAGNAIYERHFPRWLVVRDIAVDTVGDAVMSGTFETGHSPIDFDPGPEQANVSGDKGAFVAKLGKIKRRLNIVSNTLPESGQDFYFTSTGGLSPASFVLNDALDVETRSQDDSFAPEGSSTARTNLQRFVNIPAGAYTVSFSGDTGYSTTLVCHDPDGGTSINGLTANIDVDEGETVTCVFSHAQNSVSGGEILVDVVTHPSVDLTTFTLGLTGPSSFNQSISLSDVAAPHASGTVPAGSGYSLSHVLPPRWVASAATCSDGSPTNNIAVSVGETVVCTLVYIRDSDGDTLPDNTDPDDDNDGMSDVYEIANGLNPLDASDRNIDSDNDGLTNFQEFTANTRANDPDTDGDAIQDGIDSEPLMSNNACSGTAATFTSVVTSSVQCGASGSIVVVPPATVRTTGHLKLIAPRVVFQNGFKATRLTVRTGHPCPACALP